MRILVVEDEPTLRETLRARLANAGFTVDVAADGEDGLFAGTEYPIDVAIVDLGLPKLPGLELIRRLRTAGKSFPILVRPGGELGFGAERENHVGARRTVIAQDQDGRILLMVAPQGFFTLHQLSLYLTESDLNLDIAVNLDGGGSTGILIANPREIISPTRPIPFVVLVHPR